MRYTICLPIVLASILSMASISPASAQPFDPKAVKEPEMTPRLNLGKLNYGTFCAECHGENAAGTDKGPTFLHRVYHPGHHADGSFLLAARRGVPQHHWRFGRMKPVEGVTDAQLQSIVEYVRALQQANGIF